MSFPFFSLSPTSAVYMFASNDTTGDLHLCSLASRLFLTLFLSTKLDPLSKSVSFLQYGILSSLSLFMRRLSIRPLCLSWLCWAGFPSSPRSNFIFYCSLELMSSFFISSQFLQHKWSESALLPNFLCVHIWSYQLGWQLLVKRFFVLHAIMSPTKPAWTLHTVSYGFLIIWEV